MDPIAAIFALTDQTEADAVFLFRVRRTWASAVVEARANAAANARLELAVARCRP